MAIVLNKKFLPLFPRGSIEGAGVPDGVRYILDFSGRAAGKSFGTACGVMQYTWEPYDILYTRYTMVSADQSIIPEFTDKMDLLGNRASFNTTKTDIINRESDSKILFRGIMASSGNQTARLKSIPHLGLWVNDESEELTRETDFNTIDESIREIGAANLIVLTGNPATIDHWIFRKFFAGRGVPYDYNGRVDDCWYIHTSYLENKRNLAPSYLAKIERLKETDYQAYEHRFLGKWLMRSEGLIYRKWKKITAAEYPDNLPQWWCNDWGYSGDPNALCRMCFDPLTRRIYVKQIAYHTGMLVPDVAKAIIADAQTIGYSPADCLVYCDPARPDNRDLLRAGYSINAVNGDNRDKVGRIGYLQGFEVWYVGDDIEREVSVYSYQPSKLNPDTFTDKPQDGGDHAMDSINYGATHLRLQYITNE